MISRCGLDFDGSSTYCVGRVRELLYHVLWLLSDCARLPLSVERINIRILLHI